MRKHKQWGPRTIFQTVVVLFPEKVLDEVLVLKPAEKRSSPIHNKQLSITSRGEIVHLPSLIKALEAKKMWGVALDVFEGEKK